MKILFVDDNPSIRELYSYYFSRIGFETHSAEYGVSGVKLAREICPDVIVLDIGLPDICGIDVLDSLSTCSTNFSPLIFVITASCDETVRQAAKEKGVVEFMLKPVSLNILAAKINSALARGTAHGGDVTVISLQDGLRGAE